MKKRIIVYFLLSIPSLTQAINFFEAIDVLVVLYLLTPPTYEQTNDSFENLDTAMGNAITSTINDSDKTSINSEPRVNNLNNELFPHAKIEPWYHISNKSQRTLNGFILNSPTVAEKTALQDVKNRFNREKYKPEKTIDLWWSYFKKQRTNIILLGGVSMWLLPKDTVPSIISAPIMPITILCGITSIIYPAYTAHTQRKLLHTMHEKLENLTR
ncbi:MAG: hypothetical protein WC707_00450 [Candidatus Babeliaceae bacterium]